MVRTIQVTQKSINHHSNKCKKLQNEKLKQSDDSNTKSSKGPEIDFNSKVMRAQGGKGLLSQSIPIQKTQESIPKTLEKKREEQHERERKRKAPASPLPSVQSSHRKRRGTSFLFPGGSHPLPAGFLFFPSKSSSKD